ncbi:MAG: ABC transporter permease subunit [Streptosporangiaceae bacterium]
MNLAGTVNFLVSSVLFNIALLAVISIGLAVIFGMMGIINLAHGEFIMIGAFFTLTGVKHGLNIWIAMPVAAVAVGFVGVAVERCLIRFLYGRLAATMLATWGLSLILVQAATLIYGPTPQGIQTPLKSFHIGRYDISEYSLAFIGVTVAIIGLVLFVFTRTRYGLMARATMQSPGMAAAVGVNAGRINMMTFAFGSALAGAAGALLAPLVGVVPSMGQSYVGQAFMTVVVGGPGVLTGTASASGLLGTVSSVTSNLVNSVLGSVALLVVAVILLRLMPTGLSGRWGRKL